MASKSLVLHCNWRWWAWRNVAEQPSWGITLDLVKTRYRHLFLVPTRACPYDKRYPAADKALQPYSVGVKSSALHHGTVFLAKRDKTSKDLSRPLSSTEACADWVRVLSHLAEVSECKENSLCPYIHTHTSTHIYTQIHTPTHTLIFSVASQVHTRARKTP